MTNDDYKILGYIDILEHAQPCGRYIHDKLNKLAALKMHVRMDKTIDKQTELAVKELIHKLYL